MSKSDYFIEALARGLVILSVFSRERPTLSFSDIVRATELNKSTVYRIVYTLEQLGYLEKDEKMQLYRPGIKVLNLGYTALTSLDIRETARPYLTQLSKELGETVSLSILDGVELIYVDRIRAGSILGIVLGLGSRIPAHCASMGKVMLAFLPSDELAARLDGLSLTPCTRHTIIEKETFIVELERIREEGYATNNEELARGLLAVAAPIRNDSGDIIAAINCSVLVGDYTTQEFETKIIPAVINSANLISSASGYDLIKQ